MKDHMLRASPTALYAQLASVLRSQIQDGLWRPNDELPAIHELCDRYGVSKITVSKTIQLLVEEGLLLGGRGKRITVSARLPSVAADRFGHVLDGVRSTEPDYRIILLERDEKATLPQGACFTGTPVESYTRFKKVHLSGGMPYSLMNIYIAQTIAGHFPKDIERQKKLIPFVKKYAKPKLVAGQERITVAAADYEEAKLLDYPMASPVAKVNRVVCNMNDEAVYVGFFTYRSDRFGVEQDIALNKNPPENARHFHRG